MTTVETIERTRILTTEELSASRSARAEFRHAWREPGSHVNQRLKVADTRFRLTLQDTTVEEDIAQMRAWFAERPGLYEKLQASFKRACDRKYGGDGDQ